jgi:4-hydroxybenzoate polyprenyltransferase
VSAPPGSRGPALELGRYLELRNLGLNLPFAIAFLLLAAGGAPPLVPLALAVVAFVAARNAGHSFNRWADRKYDAANPRTRDRALVVGRFSGRFALAFTAANGALLVVAAYLLNPLAFALSGVALGLILGYSYTKRYSALTTPFLGLVEAITPAAAYIALRATLPWDVLLAVGAMLAYGTAFETIHSLGDLASDRALGLRSLPLRLGRTAALRLVPGLHLLAGALWALFGLSERLAWPYFVGVAALGVIAGVTDVELRTGSASTRRAFERHFLMSAAFLLGVLGALAGAGRLFG